MSDRPKVGPADPATVHKMLEEKLNEPTKSTGIAAKAAPPAKKKKRGMMDDVTDLLDPSKPRERVAGTKGKSMSEAIDEGIEEGNQAKPE